MTKFDSIIDQILIFSQTHHLINEHDRIVVGLSGGPDSVFLLHLLHSIRTQYAITIIAAHLNHEMRQTADYDEQFCRTLCHQLEIPFYSAKLSQVSEIKTYDGSFEAHARNARRALFESIAAQHHAQAIALAHHKQDQQENFFIRLLRGTSLTGLTGIKPRQGLYIRPLLHTSKDDIIAYLAYHHLSYCTDETNLSDRFLRNRVRSYVIPALKKADPRFDYTFEQTLERLQETEAFLQQLMINTYDHITKQEAEKIYLHMPAFLALHVVLQYRILIHWFVQERVPFIPTQALFKEAIRFFMQKKSNTHALHHAWTMNKTKEYVFLSH